MWPMQRRLHGPGRRVLPGRLPPAVRRPPVLPVPRPLPGRGGARRLRLRPGHGQRAVRRRTVLLVSECLPRTVRFQSDAPFACVTAKEVARTSVAPASSTAPTVHALVAEAMEKWHRRARRWHSAQRGCATYEPRAQERAGRRLRADAQDSQLAHLPAAAERAGGPAAHRRRRAPPGRARCAAPPGCRRSSCICAAHFASCTLVMTVSVRLQRCSLRALPDACQMAPRGRSC